MTIRNTTLEDLNTIHEIETLSFNEGSYPLFALRQFYDISGAYFLVAEEHGKISGYAIGNLSNNLQGWILSLGVHPEARGNQIGKKLTEKLIELLENNQCKEICLTVHPENTSAIKIYNSLEFQTFEKLENYYLDNEKRLLLKRTQPIH